jgi:hypothetical protein
VLHQFVSIRGSLASADLGLIDEYEFLVQPRLAGHGPTLFAGPSQRVDLKLVSRLEFGSGAVASSVGTTNQPFYALETQMKRVTGIGGIFFKAKDAPSLRAWYKRHLGIDVQPWGGAAFDGTDARGKPVAGTTAWLIDPQESDHFAPSAAPFMVALVKVLKEEGCNVLDKIDESEYGKFAWVIDPEGNKVELWQPPAGQ